MKAATASPGALATGPSFRARPAAWPVTARVLAALALLSLIVALVIGLSWRADRARLRAVAEAATAGAVTESDRLTRIVGFVYRNQGFAKNRNFFLWKKLDATPVQVLERGGDCEDKSKLTAALLRELGVRSTLAMISPCAGCPAGHTVAVVKTQNGWTPVDSVYDITFPEPGGRFTPIERLRANPSIQAQRVADLRVQRGPYDKINHFPLDRDPFTHATTVNWDKNVLTRAVAGAIRATGGEPWRTPRPMFLDDPKQFFMLAFLGLAAVLGVLGMWAGRQAR